GTVPFQPHLTVCGPELDPASFETASDYVRRSRLLPLTVAKRGISWSTTVPFRSVVIDVDDTPNIRTFREDLRRITGAGEPAPPHISLLYAFDGEGGRPSWSSDESKLRAI